MLPKNLQTPFKKVNELEINSIAYIRSKYGGDYERTPVIILRKEDLMQVFVGIFVGESSPW